MFTIVSEGGSVCWDVCECVYVYMYVYVCGRRKVVCMS